MDTTDRYCDECGAANTREATICFACARPLDAPSTRWPEHDRREEAASDAQVSAAPVYMQITLSANAQTTIQLVQSQPQQPTMPLLHDRYRVLSQVGTGGFGAVYKARDLQANGRMVAIKAIELDTLSASQAIEATDTFNRELGLLSSLDHPHLPTIYEHFIDETHWYLVMDFIDGEPLDEYLQQIQTTSLPLKQVLNIGTQLCDVLRYLHQLHPPVIFRDLKPANIMRTPGGRLYLIDFGIARRFKPGQTRDTTPLGSPGFAAPEQYGKAQTTPRSDIYSLGATLYFLLTGYDPATTPFHLPPIRTLCPTLPEPLAELITAMLARDPAERPASIAAVQQVLNNYGPSTRHTTVLAQSRVFAAASSPPPPPVVPAASAQKLKNFLKGIFSIAITGLVIAACTLTAHFMGVAAGPPFNTGPVGSAPAPLSPAVFRMPYIGQITSLDPFTTTDPQAADLENLLFGRLVSPGTDGAVAQGIANSWTLSPDGLTWTFHLSNNASFSDGSPITAQDVAASLDYALSRPLASTTCSFFSLVKNANLLRTHRISTLLGNGLSIFDPQTISITTARPASYFPATLATPCGSIVKKSDLATWDKDSSFSTFMHMAFSSTYTFAGYGSSGGAMFLSLSALSANSQPGSQAPSQITVQSYPDVAASYAAYTTGQLDMSPTPDNLSGQSPDLRQAHPLTLHYYGMNYLAKPFDNLAIRQAFALALAKDALTALNVGLPTNSLLGSWRSQADNGSPSGDPLRAKQLLVQGLEEEGLNAASQLPPIVFAYQSRQTSLANEVRAARQRWSEVLGITVVLRPMNNLSQAIAATRGNRSLQLWAADYTPAYRDPYALVGLPFAQGSLLNAVNFGQNSSADAAAQQELQRTLAGNTLPTGTTSAVQMYQQADQTLVADVAWLPISMITHFYVIRQGFAQPFSSAWSPWSSADYCSTPPPC